MFTDSRKRYMGVDCGEGCFHKSLEDDEVPLAPLTPLVPLIAYVS